MVQAIVDLENKENNTVETLQNLLKEHNVSLNKPRTIRAVLSVLTEEQLQQLVDKYLENN